MKNAVLATLVVFAAVSGLNASGFTAYTLKKNPALVERAVRSGFPGDPLEWLSPAVVDLRPYAAIVAYVRGADWHGFARLVQEKGAWKIAWKVRWEIGPKEDTFLQVQEGWTVGRAGSSTVIEATYLGCRPYNCCGEFGLAIINPIAPRGWVVHVRTLTPQKGAPSVAIQLETEGKLPGVLRSFVEARVLDQICPSENTPEIRASVSQQIEALCDPD